MVILRDVCLRGILEVGIFGVQHQQENKVQHQHKATQAQSRTAAHLRDMLILRDVCLGRVAGGP